ncbi:MAG: ornithine carbamoyltransferase [Candidatus Omnitrophica bacterium]|nr:ornithine carbamoyltransferase [Candidatus Omnitrophota bacterium]
MLRHFLTLTDFSETELRGLLACAKRCKRERGYGRRTLTGKTVALVFQKPSMRTRVAFEVAVLQLGGAVVYLGQEDIQLGQREPIKDVARVLSRYVDGIVVRTFAHRDAEEFARHASCPVINGLSDLVHPCQALADLFTMEECFHRLKGLTLCYVGDGNNVLHSLLEGCAMFGVHAAVASPPGYRPDGSIWKSVGRRAKAHGASIRWDEDPKNAARGADVLYTDVWVSMGQERERAKRLRAFRPYQLSRVLLQHAKPGCRIMHCLPAHRGEEITDEVMESPQSLILAQAENRLHVQKALLLMLLARANR